MPLAGAASSLIFEIRSKIRGGELLKTVRRSLLGAVSPISKDRPGTSVHRPEKCNVSTGAVPRRAAPGQGENS